MAIVVDKRVLIDEACSTAQEFTKLYYECLDKKRNLVSRLYMDTAVLVWNGSSVAGNMVIQAFLEKLPVSDHQIISLDAQPVHDEAIKGQSTIMVTVAGIVRYEKKPAQPFCQDFLITAQESKWKVVSDCLRFQKVLS
ncbi:NTF2-related export protein 1-like [Daphnia pulicaria]|uniref:NTF2-related export protein 1-like n=1 Tax=Daphnia pulicaria TaxID=35523 RepID=UPI001EEA3AE6|nr:NTF2-related export protein 1-like [Daphnia pulicaria]